jgi:hypothetical protein
MRPVIDRTDRDFEIEPVVVRVDFSDGRAWQKIIELLDQAAVTEDFTRLTHFVDDAMFADASSPEVVESVLAGDSRLEVVFLADSTTMKYEHLLAVATMGQEREEDEEVVSSEFRIWHGLVHEMHTNLAIGHMDFYEFSYYANQAPGGVLRW